ncbi:hypothetical protein KHQ81_04755 [Mycoplasmatota bacterium]|nr:hypothetical protein KHQ81_04755 [Mycoplasmatota bacterium]
MERLILFPKNEFKYYNEGKKCFKNHHYEKAIFLFEKAMKLKYLKKDCIKYVIDCHIELHQFEEVYKMIENEFIDKNVEETYLIKKYLYTMVLEEQYIEVNELIKIYKENKDFSVDFKSYLDELQILVEEKLSHQNGFMMKFFKSDDFEDHIQIILNLEKLNVSKYEIEINQFLNNPQIDSFVKFIFLKYLITNNIKDELNYTNHYGKQFLITKENFIDVLNDNRYIEPIDIVLKNEKINQLFEKAYIRNIWLDFCIKYYPQLIDDLNLASAVLHTLLLKTISLSFNTEDISKLYQIELKRLFYYF